MVTSPNAMDEENDQANSSVAHIPQYKVIKRKDAPKLLSPLYLRKVNDSSSQTPRGSINMPPANWQIGNPPSDCQSNVTQNQESNAGFVILNPEGNASSQNWENNPSGSSQNQETNTDQNQQTNAMIQTVSSVTVPSAHTNKLSAHNFVNYDGNINGNKVIIVKNLQTAGINNIDSTSRGIYKGVTSTNKACTIVGPFDTQATEAAVRSITHPNITPNVSEPVTAKPKLYPNAYPIILPPMKHNVSPKKGISAMSTPYSVVSRKITAPVLPTAVGNTDTAKNKNPGIAVVRNQVVNYNIHYSPALNAVDNPVINSIDPSAKPAVVKKGLNDVVAAKRKILVLPKNMVTVDPRKKIILSPEPSHKTLASPDGRFAFSPISESSGGEQASEIRSKMESTEAANILVQLSNMDPSLAVKRTSGSSINPLTNGSFAYTQSTIANSSDNVPSTLSAEFQDMAAQILSPKRNNSQQNFSNDDDVCVVPQQVTEVEIYDDDDRKSVFSLDDYGLTETVSSADALKSLIGYKNYNILLSALCGIKDLSTKSRALAAFFSVNKEYRTSHCQTMEAEANQTGLSQSTVQAAQTLPLETVQKKNFSKASFQTQTSPPVQTKPAKDGGTQCSPQKEFVNTQGQKRVRNNQGQRSPQKLVKGAQGQQVSPQKQLKRTPNQLSPQKSVIDVQVQHSPQKQLIKDVRSGDSSPQKNANITLNGSVTLKTVNRMKNSNSTPAKQLDRMKNLNISPLKQQNTSDGAITQTLQFAPHFKSSTLTASTKINNEKDRQLMEKVSGLKGVTVSANRKPSAAHKPPQAANKSPRAQSKSSRAPNKPARGPVKSQQPGTKQSPVRSMIVNKSQQIANVSQTVVNKSQPIQNISQVIVNKSQQIVSKSRQISKSQPTKNISQPIASKSQPIANNSQQTVNVSQPVASETTQAEAQPSQVAKKPSRAANKSPRVETKTAAPVVSEAPVDTEPIVPQIATRVETPEKSITPRLEDVIQHDKHGLMKIHSAVLSGTLFDIRHCAEELHSLGLSIDQKTTPDGYTALHMALIRRKNADVLYMLLSLGADPSANNHRDQPSLLLATKPRALKQGVPDAPPPPFLGLLAATQPHVVEQVCRQTDSQGLTAIMHCARHGWADELELLLEHTPRSVVTMEHHQTGQTPLDMAMACCADLPKGTYLESAVRCVQLLRNALGIIIEEEVKEYPVQKVRPCNLSIKYAPAAEDKLTAAKERTEEANTNSTVKAVSGEEVPKNKDKKSRNDSKKRKENKNKENGAEKIPKNKNSEEAGKKKSSIGKLDLNDISMISSPQFSPVVPLEKPQGRKSSFKKSSRKRKLNLEDGSIIPKVSATINMKTSAKISSVLSNAVKVDVIKDVTHSDIVTEVQSKDIKPKEDVKTKTVGKSPVKCNPSSKRRKVMKQKKDTALESHGTVKRMILDVGIEVPVDTVISDPDHQVLREVSPIKTKNRINILDKINTEQDNSTSKKTPSVAKPRGRSAGSKKDIEKVNKSAVLLDQSGDVIGDYHVETQGPVTGDLENANPLIVGDVLPPTLENNVDSVVAAFGNENAVKPKKGRRKQLKCSIKKVIQKKTPAKSISVPKVAGNRVGRKKITSSVVSAAEKVVLKKTVVPSPKESEVIAIPEAESTVKNIPDIPILKPLCSKSVIHVNLNNMRFSSTYAEIRSDKYIQPKVIISKIINRSVRDIFANTPSEDSIVQVDEELIDDDSVIENNSPFVDLTDDNSMSEFPKEVPLELRQDSVLIDGEALNLPSSQDLPGETDKAATLGDVDCGQIPKTGSGQKRKYSTLKSPNNSFFKMKFKLNLSKNELKKIHTKNSRQSKKFKTSETPAKKNAKNSPVKRVSKKGTNETKEFESELNKSKDSNSDTLNTSESKLSKKKIKNPSVVKSATKKIKNPSVVKSATKKTKLSKTTRSPGPTTPKTRKLLTGSQLVSPLTSLKKSVSSKIQRNSLGTIDQDLEMINKAVKDQTQPDRPPPVLSYLSLYHN